MDKRKEFEQLLSETIIDSNTSQEFAKEKITNIQRWIINNIPNKLYRFRKYSDYSIKALKNDEIWGSNLWEFNDPYEFIPFYNLDVLENFIEKGLSYDNISQNINLLKSNKIPKELENALGRKVIDELINRIPDDIDSNSIMIGCQLTKKQIIDFITCDFQSIIDNFFISILQAESQRHIACFCEKNDLTLMWGHYSDSHKGFCLEYDFTSNLKPCVGECNDIRNCNNFMLIPSIVPVIYEENRFDATSHLLTIIEHYLSIKFNIPLSLHRSDTLLISKCLLSKSIDWKYEKEWRLFSPPCQDTITPHKKIFNAKPTALYIGRKTPIEQEKELSDICKYKSIPCYKMVQNYYGRDFSFHAIPYDDYVKSSNI